MANPLYNQLMPQGNPMIQRLMEFKRTFSGNPQQIVQEMLNSGKLTQAQVNSYAQQANQIYQQFKGFIK